MDFEPHTQQLVRPKIQGDLRRVQKDSIHDLPRHTSIRNHKRGWDSDNASARWKILRRMIASGVGRPWDDVYSHILTKFKRNREADRQTLQSIDYLLDQNCVEREVRGKKVIYDTEGRCLMGGDLYVHPETGILSKVPGERFPRMDGAAYHQNRYRWYPNEQQEVTFIKIGKNHYRKVNGVWYEVVMKKLPNDSMYPMVHDVVVSVELKKIARESGGHPNTLLANYSRREYLIKYGSYSYADEKRQLNKRELKTLIYPRLPAQTLPDVA